jgi:IPT/TIG domain
MIEQIRSVRTGRLTAFVVASVLVVGFLAGVPTASAAAFTGGFSPTIIGGGADLNGDGVVNGRDDSNEFFGDTSIIDGHLDCDTWGVTKNAGSAGSGTITAADDCTLVGYDGTDDGVTITVTDGVFGWTSGTALPTVYNATNPDSPGVFVADFAWSTIDGKVDSNGKETIDGNDCHFGLIGQTVDVGLGDATDGVDILGSDAGCGFAGGPLSSTLNGLVDLNSDVSITAADSCTNGCFFGHNVTNGIVQGGGALPTITSFTPTAGPVGTTVTITGTNLTGATSVKFNGVSATITSNTATQIVTKVPTGATTGPITVTTPSGTATSATNFTVTGPPHARTISLRLRDSLIARGTVSVSDGFAACADSVPVKVQRMVSGRWKTVKSTTTSSTGTYRTHLRNRHGRYRSVAPMVVKGTDTCGRAVSPTRRH